MILSAELPAIITIQIDVYDLNDNDPLFPYEFMVFLSPVNNYIILVIFSM